MRVFLKATRFLPLHFFFLGAALVTSLTVFASAQEAPAQGVNAGSLLNQLSTAFSGGKTVQRVQLSGSATWKAGGLEDSGTVSLTASADGSSEMQLFLASTGQRTETQAAGGPDATCQWAGADGHTHEIRSGACWRPVNWLLPTLSLQPSLLNANTGIVDLGSGAVGSNPIIYRHLQSQFVFPDLSKSTVADVMQRSTTDVGLDPVSLLPAALTYSVHPDNGAMMLISIEVRYSDYRVVGGAQIPFTIQRYVNGSLQLQISISSAQVN